METELFNKVLPMNADTEGRIKGTVLVIIFHQLQFLNNSIRDTSKSCQLANTSAEVLDRFPYHQAVLPVVASYVVFLLDDAKVTTYS